MRNPFRRHVPVAGIELLEEVTYQKRIISPDVARAAGRIARHINLNSKLYPFAFEIPGFPELTNLGWAREGMGYGSIWAFKKDHEQLWPLMMCSKKLLEFSGVDNPRMVHILHNNSAIHRLEHQDFYNGTRSLLLLDGRKDIGFRSAISGKTAHLFQEAGDAYKMEFTDDESTSLWHTVHSLDTTGDVALFVTTELN